MEINGTSPKPTPNEAVPFRPYVQPQTSNQTDHSTSASHDHSSNETRSETERSKNESQIAKFSSRLKVYRNREFEGSNDDESFVGCGNFSAVHKYHHRDLETVAIKRFNITGSAKRVNKAWEMVQREANVLCRFKHPNVLAILGITKWLNAVGIIMEYVEGGDLKDLLEDGETDLTWSTRLQIALGLISALSYIHSYKKNKVICHGDLKPENILLTKSQEVKLADFGSAALYKAAGASATTLDIAPSKQHTLQYVAPELLKDLSRERNPAMDMYSFGSILYEVMTGKAPYANFPQPTALSELITAGSKPNTKLIDQVESQVNSPEDRSAFNLLKNLMERCWNNDPAWRPSSKTVEKEMRDYMQKLQPRGPTHRGSPPVASFEEASWNESENEAGTDAETIQRIAPMARRQFSQRPVSDMDMGRVADEIGASWRKMGRLMGLTDGHLDAINNDFRIDGLYEKGYHTILKWTELQVNPPVQQLVEILYSMDKSEIVDKLENETIAPASRTILVNPAQPTDAVDSAPPRHNPAQPGTPSPTTPQPGRSEIEPTTHLQSIMSRENHRQVQSMQPEEHTNDDELSEQMEMNGTSPKPTQNKPVPSRLYVQPQASSQAGPSMFHDNNKPVRDLLTKYTSSLLNKNFEQADSLRATLRTLIINELCAEAEEVRVFGEKLDEEKNHLEAVAIFDTAAALFAKMESPDEDLERIQFCIQGMKIANEKLIEEDSNMKVIVRDHVIPLMRNWVYVMRNTWQVSEKWKCHTVSWVLYHIDLCLIKVDEHEEGKRALEAVAHEMRKVFGRDIHKQHGRLFGSVVHNLGIRYKYESRFEEAVALFKESIQAHQEGIDYFGNEEDRKRDIKMSENSLKGISQEIWKKQLQMQ